jgi:hypothetical protein
MVAALLLPPAPHAQLAGGGGSPPPTDGRFTIARLKYSGGGDWYNDPAAEVNLLGEVARRTGASVQVEKHVVSLSDAELFSYPMLFATGHGKIALSDREATRLRRYLEAGGFLYVDDDYGMDESLRKAIAAALPGAELVELPFNHPVYRSVYAFPQGLPKTHEHYPGAPHGYGAFVNGRLAVLYTYNTNISDGWVETHNDPAAKRDDAMKMGVNIAWYALTQ